MLLQGAVLCHTTNPSWWPPDLPGGEPPAQGAPWMNQQTPASTGFQEELGLGSGGCVLVNLMSSWRDKGAVYKDTGINVYTNHF